MLFAVYARRVHWRETWDAARHASAALLMLATLVNIASLALKGLRWWVFLRPVGSMSPWMVVRATFAGAGFNSLLVANAGDAARVVFVSRATAIPGATVLATLALEKSFDVIGFVLLLVAVVFVLPLPTQITRLRWPAVGVLVILAVVFAWLARRGPNAEETATDGGRRSTAWSDRLVDFFRRFVASIAAVSNGPRFAAALAITIVCWITQYAVYALTAAAAHAPLSVAGNVAVLVAVNVAFVIRVTPGNVGLFQLLYVMMAGQFGMPAPTALAVSLLIQALQIIPIDIIALALAPQFVLARRARRDTTGA